MANYFVLDNTFDPYSFDELVKPYLMYREAYREQEAAADKLESDAATLASAISQTNDPNAYQTYNLYLDRVRQAADDLATNGLTLNSRRAITSLGRDYNNSIVPIQAAYNRRKELQDEQRKAMLANDSMMFQRDFNVIGPESSIDRFVEDPNYSYGKAVSGNAITARTSEMASHLAKELTDYGQGKPLDKYTNTFLQSHGFTREQVLNAIQNPQDPTAEPVLNAIARSAVDASGVPTWNDEAALKRAYDYAGMGLWSAIGQSNVSTFENYGNRLAAQEAMQKRVKMYGNEGQNPTVNGIPINPVNIFGAKERSEAASNIEKYSDYFRTTADGKTVLTEKGKAEYNRQVAGGSGGKMVGNTYVMSGGPSDFRKFVDSITGNNGDLGKAWSDYVENHREDLWDARRITEYKENYSTGQQQDKVKQKVLEAAAGTKLKEMDYDANKDKFVETNNTLDLSDLAKTDYKIVGSRMSSRGSFIMVQGKDGETKRYRLPAGINPSAEASRDEMLGKADAFRNLWQDTLTSGTVEEQIDAQLKYDRAVQEAYLYHSQLGLASEINNVEYNPYKWY